jgi:hypothetical protein
MLKKVLIMDSDPRMFELWRMIFADKVEILPALTTEEGQKLLNEHPDIEMIALSSLKEGNASLSPAFVKKNRSGFHGKIVAMSGNYIYQDELMNAGCDISCDKVDMPKTVLSLIEQLSCH